MTKPDLRATLHEVSRRLQLQQPDARSSMVVERAEWIVTDAVGDCDDPVAVHQALVAALILHAHVCSADPAVLEMTLESDVDALVAEVERVAPRETTVTMVPDVDTQPMRKL